MNTNFHEIIENLTTRKQGRNFIRVALTNGQFEFSHCLLRCQRRIRFTPKFPSPIHASRKQDN